MPIADPPIENPFPGGFVSPELLKRLQEIEERLDALEMHTGTGVYYNYD